MPIYEYVCENKKCENFDKRTEIFVELPDNESIANYEKCEKCHKDMKKCISTISKPIIN
jgi:predicted nucleic acid-binding Zn ribbon protein